MHLAILSSFPPKQCGVGEFCFDLLSNLVSLDSSVVVDVYAIDNIPEGYVYDPIVKEHFFFQHREGYIEAARAINESPASLCLIQHEFGLFGGENRSYLADFVTMVKKPLVVILHTVPIDPSYETFDLNRAHLLTIAPRVSRFVTISQSGKDALVKVGIAEEKISVIAHGAPAMPPLSEAQNLKKIFGLGTGFTITHFGLLNKQKGIEYLLTALATLRRTFPTIRCLLIGVPLSQKHTEYVNLLKASIVQQGLQDSVIFLEKYFKQNELCEHIVASDVVVTPYLSTNQTSSGVLTFSIAAGIPTISTPYPYASELLKTIGILVPYKDSDAIVKEVTKLINDKEYYKDQQKRTLEFGKTFSWRSKAYEYLALFTSVIHHT